VDNIEDCFMNIYKRVTILGQLVNIGADNLSHPTELISHASC